MNKKKKNNKGQALIELMIFIPFLIVLFFVLLSITNAINGAINQQKIVRGYFYARLKNNSFYPNKRIISELKEQGITKVSQYALGWREKSSGIPSFATCYAIKGLSTPVDDSCDEKSTLQAPSDFIKLLTYYGICGQNYSYDTESTGTQVILDDLYQINPCGQKKL